MPLYRAGGGQAGGGGQGLATHEIDTTNVHGISDTANLVLTTDARLSDSRTPTAHTHPQSDITNLPSKITSLELADSDISTTVSGHTSATTSVHGISNAANLVYTTDSRLSDSRTPLAHTHAITDVTNLQTSLNGKADVSHTHSISDVTNLQTSLDGKANSTHTHAISDVTNLQTSLDGKASSTHTHAISDVTNLQTSLNGKADTSHTHTIANVTNLQTTLDGKAASVHGHTISDVNDLQAGLDEKVSKNSASATPELPVANVPTSRFGTNPPKYSNGLSAGTSFSLPSNNISLSPIWIPISSMINEFSVRTSGSAMWGTNAVQPMTFGIYNVSGVLPSGLAYSQQFNIPANATANTVYTFAMTANHNLLRGIYWIAILNRGAVTAEMTGTLPSGTNPQLPPASDLLNNLFGVGLGQSSTANGIRSSVSSGTDLPASMDSRNVDMVFATASTTTLRLSSNAVMYWLGYQTGLSQPVN